jgi:hypothetical protein
MLSHLGCGRPITIIDPGNLSSWLSLVSLQSAVAVQRRGHLESVKHIVAYRGTRLRTNENDFSPFGTSYHDWMSKDNVPTVAPLAMVHYVDDNRMQDMIPGVSVTGCTHLLNQTSETATYGTAFLAAMNRMEQSLAIGTLLRYPAVPVGDEGYVTGNHQVVKIFAPPETKSLHRVQKTTTASMVIVMRNHWGN